MAERRFKNAPPPAVVVVTPTATPGIYEEATSLGGGSGGTTNVTVSAPTITNTQPGTSMVIGSTQAQLALPTGVNQATVHVISGSINRAINGVASASTPLIVAGGNEEISGAELAAYRMTRNGSTDATVWIEWRVS